MERTICPFEDLKIRVKWIDFLDTTSGRIGEIQRERDEYWDQKLIDGSAFKKFRNVVLLYGPMDHWSRVERRFIETEINGSNYLIKFHKEISPIG